MQEDARKCATENCDGLVFGDQTYCHECIKERRIRVVRKLDRRRLRNNERHIRCKKQRRDRFW